MSSAASCSRTAAASASRRIVSSSARSAASAMSSLSFPSNADRKMSSSAVIAVSDRPVPLSRRGDGGATDARR